MADAALTARLRSAAQIVADEAQRRSGMWSRRIPASIRLAGGARSVTIVAGNAEAPHAYTFEGKKSGAPRYHPVYAQGPRSDWTWVPQPPRPFLKEAIDAKQDQMLAEFANVIDDWARQKGFG